AVVVETALLRRLVCRYREFGHAHGIRRRRRTTPARQPARLALNLRARGCLRAAAHDAVRTGIGAKIVSPRVVLGGWCGARRPVAVWSWPPPEHEEAQWAREPSTRRAHSATSTYPPPIRTQPRPSTASFSAGASTTRRSARGWCTRPAASTGQRCARSLRRWSRSGRWACPRTGTTT